MNKRVRFCAIGAEEISRLRLRLRLQVQTATNTDFCVEENKIYTYNAVCRFFGCTDLALGFGPMANCL